MQKVFNGVQQAIAFFAIPCRGLTAFH